MTATLDDPIIVTEEKTDEPEIEHIICTVCYPPYARNPGDPVLTQCGLIKGMGPCGHCGRFYDNCPDECFQQPNNCLFCMAVARCPGCGSRMPG